MDTALAEAARPGADLKTSNQIFGSGVEAKQAQDAALFFGRKGRTKQEEVIADSPSFIQSLR